ncbi:MAG TPA: response regulator, partial [Spirochaetota bacterium]|nr:response regulator [Spirochaetota bacterium]
APEHLDHIFEPLYTTKEKGSGLGLAIVYAIVKRHKGFIDVMSTPGTGTSFYIYLPVQPLHNVADETQNHALQAGTGTIIIIDDDDNICLLYQEALKLGGLQAITFTNPNEAFAYIDAHKDTIMLVVSDVRMPTVSGEDVLDYIKNNYPDIPVVLMSGYYDDTMKEQLLRKGAYQVWQKMYDIHEIVHKVKGVLNNYARKNNIRS